MTANQIAYQNMLETKRSNVARERETQRHNQASEEYYSGSLAESIRSNMAREAAQHEQNLISWGNLSETRRTNVAKETETNRSNLAHELETARSNLAKERETTRSNLAREEETRRHNINFEGLDAAKAYASTFKDYAQGYKSLTDNLGLPGLAKSILGF